MTVNASNILGGAAAPPTTVNATAATTAASLTEQTGATAAASVFLAMLAGMTELPATPAVLAPAATGEDTEVAPDPSIVPVIDAATQALIAALTPPIAAPPVAAATTRPAETDGSAAAPAAAASPAAPGPAAGQSTESDPLLQLADATRAAAAAAERQLAEQRLPDAGKSAVIAVAIEAVLPGDSTDTDDVPAATVTAALPAAAPNAAAPVAAPAAGTGLAFSPLQLVTQLGRSVAQTTGGTDQPQPPLQHAVGSARWAEELGSRLTLMAGQGQQSGSLRLTPEHLGPLEVRIDIKDDVANVFFGSQHADTRSALNEAMPRLRELFAASGLLLGDTGVSRDTQRQDARAAEPRRYGSSGQDIQQIGGELQVTSSARHAGLLDTYA